MSFFGGSRRWAAVAILVGSLGSFLGPLRAAAQHTQRVLSQREAAQFGLYRAWYGHFSRAGLDDRIGGAVLYVPPAPQLKQQADQQDENASKPDQQQPSSEPAVTAPLMLYVYSEHGRLHAVEAETGRVHWTVQVGNRRFRCERPAVSSRWIAVIHGLELKLLDRETGELVWEQKLRYTSAVGPAILREWVLVPSVGGRVVGTHAEDPTRRWYAVADSQIFTPPAATTNSFIWCTARGNVYVGRYENGKFPFVLPTKSLVTAQPTVWGTSIYVPTHSGFVYAVDTRNGTLQWRHTAADPIFEPVVATNDAVFIVHLLGACHCLDRLTGRPRWSTTGIKKILAVSRHRVYALARDGKVVVLDRTSGVRVGTLPWYPGDLLLTNLQTDRIYVGTRHGFLICVRELAQKVPLVHRHVAQQKPRSGSPQQDAGQDKDAPKDAFDF